jgi:PadR family transcriptional regulator, regulatory protein PadR
MVTRAASFATEVSELLVLRLLSEREMYGYELAKAVQALTRQRIRLGEGLLYPLLHALEEQRLLRSRRETVAGRPRIYYRTTAGGRRHLASLIEHWRQTSAVVSVALGEGSHA